tara:strand:- start:204 stop:947 length:744 start_codon:yes stop_codon:yes gene_type:complete
MSNDKKWASNDKDQLLVESFRNFMKEGEFKATEELNEFGGIMRGLKRMGAKLTGNYGSLAKQFEKNGAEAANLYKQLTDMGLSRQTMDRLGRKMGNYYGEDVFEDMISQLEVDTNRIPAPLENMIDYMRTFFRSQRWRDLGSLLEYVPVFANEFRKMEANQKGMGTRDKKAGDNSIVQFAVYISIQFLEYYVIDELKQILEIPELEELSNYEKLIKSPKFQEMDDYNQDQYYKQYQKAKKEVEKALR